MISGERSEPRSGSVHKLSTTRPQLSEGPMSKAPPPKDAAANSGGGGAAAPPKAGPHVSAVSV
jgi:hypothetical protein